jgi:hypothetical protein
MKSCEAAYRQPAFFERCEQVQSNGVAGFVILWDCKNEESMFDSIARDCPVVSE